MLFADKKIDKLFEKYEVIEMLTLKFNSEFARNSMNSKAIEFHKFCLATRNLKNRNNVK